MSQTDTKLLRVCHFCEGPIPEDEKAVEAKTKNAWAHFECWYDGTPFKRDPETGERLTEPVEPRADLEQPVFIAHCVDHGWQAGDGKPREDLVRCLTCGAALPQFSLVHARYLAASEEKRP